MFVSLFTAAPAIFFSYLAVAATLDLWLALLVFGSEASFTCHT
jgi:hypothetical protein